MQRDLRSQALDRRHRDALAQAAWVGTNRLATTVWWSFQGCAAAGLVALFRSALTSGRWRAMCLQERV